jgi:ABC-type transport system substrate-binding protein
MGEGTSEWIDIACWPFSRSLPRWYWTPALCARLRPRQEGAEAHVLRVNWGYFPETLDPQLSHSGQWSISGGLAYEGLTRIGDDLQVIPGAAETWEFGPDDKTLTFHLRDGLVFGDGVPVTAAHFRYVMERVCSPDLDSESASYYFDVVGCEAMFAAEDAAAS